MNRKEKKKNNKSAEKKQRNFNFVDFLLIVIVLAIVAGAVYLFTSGTILDKFRKDTEGTLTYEIEINGVSEDYLNKIKENDVVINAVTKNSLGTVSAVDNNTKQTILGYEYDEEKNDYRGVPLEYSDRYTVRVTVTATAKYVKGDGYFINNCRVAVGEHMSLHFPDFAAEGYCISLVPHDDFNT